MTTDADKIDNLLAQRRELMDKIEEQIDERGRIIERIQSAPDTTPIARLRELHTCSVSGCPKPAIARGWCNLHYRRFRRHGDVLATVEPRLAWKGSPEARFWAKVNKDGPVPLNRPDLGPCWLWTAGLGGNGYGRFRANKRMTYAHRFAYELLVGPVPEGAELDHLCRVRHCTRYDHLEPVPHQVNSARGNSGKQERERTHCPQGHPYDEENTRWDRRGERRCPCFQCRCRCRWAGKCTTCGRARCRWDPGPVRC